MPVNTVRCVRSALLVGVDLKEIRRARLAQFAKLKKVEEDPSGLASLIGKKANQVNNLLSGRASFGEKVARSIEEAAELPTLWLDTDQAAGDPLPGWPFEAALLDRLVALDARERLIVQGRLEEAIASRESSRATRSDDLSGLPLQDPEVARRTSPPATETSTYVAGLKRKAQRVEGSNKSRGVPKSRGGRGSSGAA